MTTPGTDVYEAYFSYLEVAIYSGIIVDAFLIVFSIVIAVCFFRRRKIVPKMMIAYQVIAFIFAAAFFALEYYIASISSEEITQYPKPIISDIFWLVVVIIYFTKSNCVKGTFIR